MPPSNTICRSGRILLVALALVSLPTARGEAQDAPRPISVGDYADLVRVGRVVVSPDGERTIYERVRPDLENDRRVRSIWEIASRGRERQLVSDATRPLPSPSGERLAVLREGQVWIVPLRGGEPWQATRMPEPVTDMAWSPDGRSLAIVSRDPRDAAAELDELRTERSARALPAVPESDALAPGAWVPAEGEEAAAPPPEPVSAEDEPVLLTIAPQDPNSVAVGTEPAGEQADAAHLPRVIRRLQFKADGEGYVPPRYSHLYRVEVGEAAEAARPAQRLTAGVWDDSEPTWSPDGRWLAYVSSRSPEPDLDETTDLWLVAADGTRFRLTTSPGLEASPVWSPDGRWLAYRYTPAEPPTYAPPGLRMIGLYGDAEGDDLPPTETAELAPTQPLELTAGLDRPVVSAPRWRADATELYVTLQDRGTVPLVRVGTGLTPLGGRGGLLRRRPRADPEDRGRIGAIVAGPRVVGDFAVGPVTEIDDEPDLVFVMADGTNPPEIYSAPAEVASAEMPMSTPSAHLAPAVVPVDAALRRLSSIHAELLGHLALASPEPVRFESDEGVFVEGWVLRPPERPEVGGLPLIVSIHGGPVAQYTWAFDFHRQFMAAQGYAVLFVNPRGSSGYGLEFAHALWADWGGPDLRDVIAGVDHLDDRGIVDPARVGVGGWSYGGILTNYLVTRTDRFAAAVSGASITDAFSSYGVDDLQAWWEREFGLPYDPAARALYERLSAIRDIAAVTTPTLFLVGEDDWRVPASQSEQMYQQLRRRMIDGGPETALVVYPGQSHIPARPSFDIDYFLRTKAWFDRHLLGDPEADPFFGETAW